MSQIIATTPEQSARLQACGVDPRNCDMFWQIPITVSQQQSGEHILFVKRAGYGLYPIEKPAYSLSRLLSLIPIEIEDESDGLPYRFFLTPSKMRDDTIMWEAEYYSPVGEIYLFSEESPNPIEAVVRLIELLTREGYKLNTIEK